MELRRRKEELVLNGGGSDRKDPSEDVSELLRQRDDGTVEVRKWVSDIQWTTSKAWPTCARTVSWRMRKSQCGPGVR